MSNTEPMTNAWSIEQHEPELRAVLERWWNTVSRDQPGLQVELATSSTPAFPLSGHAALRRSGEELIVAEVSLRPSGPVIRAAADISVGGTGALLAQLPPMELPAGDNPGRWATAFIGHAEQFLMRSLQLTIAILERLLNALDASGDQSEDAVKARMWAQARDEGNDRVLGAAAAFVAFINGPQRFPWVSLTDLVTPESAPHWDVAGASRLLADTGMGSRPEYPAPDIAYVKFVRGYPRARTVQLTAATVVSGTIMTLQFRPELGPGAPTASVTTSARRTCRGLHRSHGQRRIRRAEYLAAAAVYFANT